MMHYNFLKSNLKSSTIYNRKLIRFYFWSVLLVLFSKAIIMINNCSGVGWLILFSLFPLLPQIYRHKKQTSLTTSSSNKKNQNGPETINNAIRIVEQYRTNRGPMSRDRCKPADQGPLPWQSMWLLGCKLTEDENQSIRPKFYTIHPFFAI